VKNETGTCARVRTPEQPYLVGGLRQNAGDVVHGAHSAGVLGIAFPVMVLFREWRYLAPVDQLLGDGPAGGNEVLRQLFAGAGDRTILRFEMGLLWPNFTANSAPCSVSLGICHRGISFSSKRYYRYLRVRLGPAVGADCISEWDPMRGGRGGRPR